jgi:ketosteroid isomerase-like protein
MRRILLCALFTAAIPFVVGAQTDPTKTKPTPPAGQQMGAVEQALLKLDRELIDAVVRNDRTLMDKVALDRSVFINPAGGIQEKGDTTGPKIESIQTEDVQARVYGDTAVVIGRANVKGGFEGGRDVSGAYRYMRVLVKQQGQWRVAAMQITPIAPSTPSTSPTPKP